MPILCVALLCLGILGPALAAAGGEGPAPLPTPPPQARDHHPFRPPTPGHLRLAFVGDINLGRHMGEWLGEKGDRWLLRACKPVLDDSDLAIANLECAVGEGGKEYTKKSVYLKAAPKDLDALAYGGIGLVTLSNNHILDYGPEVLRQTLDGLDARGILHTGVVGAGKVQQPVYVAAQGVTVAFLGFCSVCPGDFSVTRKNPGIEVALSKVMLPEVQKAKQAADFVVVLVHWGREYYGVNALQERLAKSLAQGGADLVIGSHPHVLQKIERIDRTLVAYSLGNFAFDMRYKACINSCVLQVDLERGKAPEWKTVPMVFREHRPVPLKEDSDLALDIQRVLKEGYEYKGVRSKPVVFKKDRDGEGGKAAEAQKDPSLKAAK